MGVEMVHFLIRTSSETREGERKTCEYGVTSSFYSLHVCVKAHLRPTRRQLLGRKGQMKEDKVTEISHRQQKISPNHGKTNLWNVPLCGGTRLKRARGFILMWPAQNFPKDDVISAEIRQKMIYGNI